MATFLRPCSHDNVSGANLYRSVVVLWFHSHKNVKKQRKMRTHSEISRF